MKLYKNLVNAVALIVQDIIAKGRYADKALERAFKQNPQWGSRDRRFVAEGVYDIVRNYRLYAALAESEKNFWFITAVWLVLKNEQIPSWPEFQHVDPARIHAGLLKAKSRPELIGSWPDWLWDLGVQELGQDKWQSEAEAMNQTADVYLRVNTLKTTKAKLSGALAELGIATEEVPGIDSALRLLKRENVFKTPLFTNGFFEVQDAGSQVIGDFVAPASGDVVIDACAGAGGKSLHLAGLMNNKGRIISMDVEAFKLEELKRRAKRAGVFNIETRGITGSRDIKQLEGKADKLLLDVPCSGLGVIKRNPDAKWKLSPEIIARTRQLQQEILDGYIKMLKPGGILIYSTCSVLPSENEGQIQRFLSQHPEVEFVDQKHIWPHEGTDGFYMARLRVATK